MTGRLLTAREVAELLSVPETWVREQTRAGNLPHVELGRYRRYRHDEIVAYIEESSRGGGPAWRKHRPKVAPSSSGVDSGLRD
jgi:excisionase family DNA binding protein